MRRARLLLIGVRRARLPGRAAELGLRQDPLALQAGQGGQPLRREPRTPRSCRPPARSSASSTSSARAIPSSTASTSIRRSATRRRRPPTSTSIRSCARSPSTRRRATRATAACTRPSTGRTRWPACSARSPPTPRAAGVRLRRRARRLARLPAQLQPRPRRGADRPLAGHVRAAPAGDEGDRSEAERAQAADLGGAARRQRARQEGQRRRRRLQARPRLPLALADRLRDRVLDLRRDPAGGRDLRPHRRRRARRCSAPTRPRSAAARRRSRRSSPASRSRPAPRSPAAISLVGVPQPDVSTDLGRVPERLPRALLDRRRERPSRSARCAARPSSTASPTPGWGLHLVDANIALGNLVGLVRHQAAVWRSAH